MYQSIVTQAWEVPGEMCRVFALPMALHWRLNDRVILFLHKYTAVSFAGEFMFFYHDFYEF